MPTSHDPFEKFLRQLDPLMQSPKFPSLKKSPPLYESLEFACVAARHGSGWILISGRAVLSTERCVSEARLEKVAALHEIVAFEGRMPAAEVNDLVANLRHFWVLKREKVRLTREGAGGYSWKPPFVINSGKPSSYPWRRAFALYGNDPNPSPLLSDRTLQKMDSQLRSSRRPFDGFDGLCGNLGLPVRRSNLTSSFQLSAELPARVWSVDFDPSKWALVIGIDCFGAPDLMVEWLPQPGLQKVPAGWLYVPKADDPPGIFIGIDVPGDPPPAANLILSFGELQADVLTVDLNPLLFQDGVVQHLQLVGVPKEPTVPDLATREAPNQQKFPKRPTERLLYRSKIKRAIQVQLTENPDAKDIDICRGVDFDCSAELPPSWKKDPKDIRFIYAYMGCGRRHRIETAISKVRVDMRRQGLLPPR